MTRQGRIESLKHLPFLVGKCFNFVEVLSYYRSTIEEVLSFSLLRLKVVSAFLHCSNPDHNFVGKRNWKMACNSNHAERLCRQTSGLTPVITYLERASHKGILCTNSPEE